MEISCPSARTSLSGYMEYELSALRGYGSRSVQCWAGHAWRWPRKGELPMRWRRVAIGVIAVVGIIALGASGSSSKKGSSGGTTTPTTAAPTASTAATTAPPATVPARQVTGKAVTLGAGTFTGGTDVAAGLYDVTPGPGQSGNFIVQGTNTYDEILGSNGGIGGVPKVRAQISAGDKIQIESLSQVTFTPVTTPYVTTHSLVTLYAGTWTVGQDIGPGRYVATPGAGQSGNFIVDAEGVDEILGGSAADGGVPNVTVSLSKGDVIDISSLSAVTMTPS